MERVNKIFRHPIYRECLEKITAAEAERRFCCHNMEHFLAVARIAVILGFDRGSRIDRELIYAAALLHDIGRAEQYAGGAEHDAAGAQTAGRIMPDCGFSAEETEKVRHAILAHRGDGAQRDELGELLYEADKRSRLCFECPAEGECKWSREKKNMEIFL